MTAAATIDATRTAPADRADPDELLRRLLDSPHRGPAAAPADVLLVVTILTADCPHALDRCLRSIAMHAPPARSGTRRTASAGTVASIARLHDDEEVARQYIESVRWPNGPCCPHCRIAGTAKVLGGTAMGPGWYHCVTCRRKFTVRVGTALERSHIPLRKWLHATAVISGSRRGVSVRQLGRMLRVSYRAALIMSRRIKQTMASDPAA